MSCKIVNLLPDPQHIGI